MASRDTVAVIAQQFARAFQPLDAALATTSARRSLLREMGWEFATPPPALDTLVTPVHNVAAFSDVAKVPDEQIPDLLAAVKGAFAAIASLDSDSTLPTSFRNEFPGQLTDYLVVRYFLNQQPRWGYLLMLLGILRLEEQLGAPGRVPYVKMTLALDEVDDLLGDPLTYLKGQYKWGDSAFRGDLLVDGLLGFLDAWGMSVCEDELEGPMLAALTAGALIPDEVNVSSSKLTLLESRRDIAALNAGVGLFLLPETATDKPGFAGRSRNKGPLGVFGAVASF